MIDQKITELAADFSQSWNELMELYPRYHLDGSWPSIGTLDLLLEPVRVSPTVLPDDNKMMLGAAAYLATIWHDCWSDFSDAPEIQALYDDENLPRIVLTVEKGKYLKPKERMLLDLMPVLWKVVRHPDDPFPYFEKTFLDQRLPFQRVPLFFLGMITGLSPYSEGPWRTVQTVDLVEYVAAAELFLAKSTARYYQNVYPSETLGRDPAVYQGGIIFPPPNHHQAGVITRPIFKMLDPKRCEEEDHPQWLRNLSLFPNQLISLPALLCRIALSRDGESLHLRSLVQAHRSGVKDMRVALSFARSMAGRPGLPEVALNQGDSEEAVAQLTLELSLGLHPITVLQPRELVERGGLVLLLSLSNCAWAGVADTLELVSNDDPRWLLEAAAFAAMANELDRADMLFERGASSPDVSPVAVEAVRAALLLAKNLIGPAADVLHKLFEEPEAIPLGMRRILGKILASLLELQGRNRELLELLRRAFSDEELDTTLILFLVARLNPETDDDEECRSLFERLLPAGACSPRSLMLLSSFLLAQKRIPAE